MDKKGKNDNELEEEGKIDMSMTYDDGYFEGENFEFKDEEGNITKIPYSELKNLAISNSKKKEGNTQSPNSDDANNEERGDKTKDAGKGEGSPEGENYKRFSEEELKFAKMQMDAKISTVLSVLKTGKGEDLSREEIEDELKAKTSKGEEITLDTVDEIADGIIKRKKEKKEKELQKYIDEKKKEKSPLTRSTPIIRDKTDADSIPVKLDPSNVMAKFAQFRDARKK